MTLPADSHVHSEWSWDAEEGSMQRCCARAVELGLPAVAFTEHADYTVWTVDADVDSGYLAARAPDGLFTPPAFDASGYLEAIATCRERFPGLVILSGMEVGEPHWHADAVARVLGLGRFDRVLGSLHSLPYQDGFEEPSGAFQHRPAAEVVREYLAEVVTLIKDSDVFSVLAHVDYPVRYWPEEAGPFAPTAFEDEFRYALRALADSGRALEVNTKVPLCPEIVGWWREERGRMVTFGSDAHEPQKLACGFAEAAAMVQAHGFRPGRHPHDFWTLPG